LVGLPAATLGAGDANAVLIEDGILCSGGGAGAVGVGTGELWTELLIPIVNWGWFGWEAVGTEPV
jgi:hypothetical protein